ncbi:entericidin A/B family lipoprotein [Ruegeria atlantica]|uniref:Entericidin A/B family lipoprotein n=1 Tax=Ruegeria atlantica TaxID=81569 RepID=A0AA91BQ84_9RHOB|nr:entericidin A/B family lipoprotein [Ruegeria atlantica]NOE20785.1 entericidin A/B family lipoprotein [Ruegeria atlantica]
MRNLAALIAILTLTACETVEGFGRDVSNAGNQISEEAQEAQ